MKRRASTGALIGVLSCSLACAFEPPSGEPRPDAGQAQDAHTTTDADAPDADDPDAEPSDAEPADAADATDLGPTDLGPADAGRPPIAAAGPAQRVCPGQAVELDGTGSTGDGLSFAWTQRTGPSVALEEADQALASFEAPLRGTLEFELEVTNALGVDLSTTLVQVEPAPEFELGPAHRVRAGETVELSVTSTAVLGGATFAWAQLSGPAVALIGADTATVSFTAPAAGETVELELTVTNPCGDARRDTRSVYVNRPPRARLTAPLGGLPHDTIQLDASASEDPDQDALDFEWSLLAAPAGHGGGFEPFPGTGNPRSDAPAPAFYATLPGTYSLELRVSDGLEADTRPVEFEIAGFAPLPYPNDGARLDTRALAVRASDGHVFLGTTAGAQELRAQPSDVVSLACVGSSPVTVVRAAPGGRVYFGFEGQRRIVELASGGGCVSQTHDPGSVLNPNPTSTRDIFVTERGDLYVATNADVAFFSRTSTAFTRELFFTSLGGANSDYSAVGRDGAGYYWFGSREPSVLADGAVRVLDPQAAPPNTPRIDFLSGNDDLHAFVTGLVAPPAFNELWVLSRTRGVLQLDDAGAPTVFRHYTILNGGLPPALLQDELTRGVYEPDTQDVWIAMRSGVARYKRDVGAFVAIPLGVLGVSGRVHDLALDEDASRGRTLYVATQQGAVRAISPP